MRRLGSSSQRRRAWHGAAGFTLVEMMVVLMILAIVAMAAVPSFRDATLSSKLRSYANLLVTSAYLARSEAIKRNSAVTLCASSNGTSCASTGSWEQGWIVLSGATVIERAEAPTSGFRVTSSAGLSLSFQPSGVGVTATVFTVCRQTPTVGSQERTVTVTATGKVSTDRTTNGVCS